MISFFTINRYLSFSMLAFALGSFLTVLPYNASAVCSLNGVELLDDPLLIEGTSSADEIDCSTSSMRHDIYGYGGADTITGSDYDVVSLWMS